VFERSPLRRRALACMGSSVDRPLLLPHALACSAQKHNRPLARPVVESVA